MKDFLYIRENKFPIKVAISKKEQAKGLMFQSWPPPIMVFPGELEIKKFWMKNTPSPLDLIFCKGNEIIDIFKGEPFSLKEVGPNKKCDMVIETPFGFAKTYNLESGFIIKIAFSLETLGKIFSVREACEP